MMCMFMISRKAMLLLSTLIDTTGSYHYPGNYVSVLFAVLSDI